MSVIEIIAGACLLLTSILIILAVALQSSKGEGMSSAIMGGSNSSARDRGNSNDMKLVKLTKVLAIVLFIVTVGVNIVALISK